MLLDGSYKKAKLGAIEEEKFYSKMPMGRFELPRIAPYAPQAHVSTSSTTSA